MDAREIFGGLGHVETGNRVIKRAEKAVLELEVPELDFAAQSAHDERSLAQVLGPPRSDEPRLPQADEAGSRHDGLDAGPANARHA